MRLSFHEIPTASVRLCDKKRVNTKIRLRCEAGDNHVAIRAVEHIDISNVQEIDVGVNSRGCG